MSLYMVQPQNIILEYILLSIKSSLLFSTLSLRASSVANIYVYNSICIPYIFMHSLKKINTRTRGKRCLGWLANLCYKITLFPL